MGEGGGGDGGGGGGGGGGLGSGGRGEGEGGGGGSGGGGSGSGDGGGGGQYSTQSMIWMDSRGSRNGLNCGCGIDGQWPFSDGRVTEHRLQTERGGGAHRGARCGAGAMSHWRRSKLARVQRAASRRLTMILMRKGSDVRVGRPLWTPPSICKRTFLSPGEAAAIVMRPMSLSSLPRQDGGVQCATPSVSDPCSFVRVAMRFMG